MRVRTKVTVGDDERARRRTLADHRARISVEAGLQRCRLWFAGVGIVQLFLYDADRPWLGMVIAGALLVEALVVRLALARNPGTDALRRLGWVVMAVDTLLVGITMANLLREPTDPVQMLPVIVAGEAALRWGRNGGIGGGIVAGAMTATWSVATHAQAGIELPSAFVTFRVAVMIGLGVLLGATTSAARRQRRLAEIVSDASTDLIATFGYDGRLQSVNPASEAILGYRPEELIGRDRAELIIDEDRPEGPPDLGSYGQDGSLRDELRFLHRDGHEVWLEVDLQVDPDERVICAVGRDVSERRRAEAELRRRADHDDLTGVANRAHLIGRLARDLRDRRVHLLFVDLDGFKAVNDAHGHRVGDIILREVATRIRAVGAPDDLVVRLAGDEFCVLLAAPSDDDGARRRARAIGDALAEAYDTDQGVVRLGASVGWAASLPDDRPADLLERADLAMYETKRVRRASLPTPATPVT